MGKNKTGKYLKYAIGEIILVVIGILIALQINNWNQNRLIKKDEVILVKQLLQDAKADRLFFKERFYKLKTQVHFYNNFLNHCKGLVIEKDTITKSYTTSEPFVKLAYQSNVLKNNPNAYDKLISPTLKMELQKYASKYEFVYMSIEFFNVQINEYFNPLRIAYYKKMPDFDKLKSYEELSFLCDNDTNLGIIQLIKSNATIAAKQTNEFISINATLVDKLNLFLENTKN